MTFWSLKDDQMYLGDNKHYFKKSNLLLWILEHCDLSPYVKGTSLLSFPCLPDKLYQIYRHHLYHIPSLSGPTERLFPQQLLPDLSDFFRVNVINSPASGSKWSILKASELRVLYHWFCFLSFSILITTIYCQLEPGESNGYKWIEKVLLHQEDLQMVLSPSKLNLWKMGKEHEK